MKKYSLNLYQNAIDSLNEGLDYYNKSLEDKSKYKFCIILISNFVELILKYMVELQNPLLCYEKPFSADLDAGKTITWKQAMQILGNSNIAIRKELIDDITKLSLLRNKIVHYKFEYDTSDVEAIILPVAKELRNLFKKVNGKDFIDDLPESAKELLKTIEERYLEQLASAQAEAKKEADRDGLNIVDCPFCGEVGTAVEREKETYCYFCNRTDYVVECSGCSEMGMVSEMPYFSEPYFSEDKESDRSYLCQHCSDFLFGD